MADIAGLDVQRGQALTPDKVVTLTDYMQTELVNAKKALGSSVSSSVKTIVQTTSQALQNTLNLLLSKRGIITPEETNQALDAIDASKRARLQQDFTMGIKNTTLYIGGAVVLVLGYFIYKKMAK